MLNNTDAWSNIHIIAYFGSLFLIGTDCNKLRQITIISNYCAITYHAGTSMTNIEAISNLTPVANINFSEGAFPLMNR